MRSLSAVSCLAILLLGTTSVAAQVPTAESQATPANPDVVPAPAKAGNGVLLYPDGDYGRVVRPLLQPGETGPGETIHLHMPAKLVKHVAHRKARPQVASADSTGVATPDDTSSGAAPMSVETASPPPPKNEHKKQPAQTAATGDATAPAALSESALATSIPFSFSSSPQAAAPVAQATSPAQQTTPPVPRQAAAPPRAPIRMAKASPPPAQALSTEHNVPLAHGLAKQSQIVFAAGAPDPSPDALDAIKGLAGPLNTALAAGASRVQIVGYGGNRGDRSSDARRLSLKRALIIRQLLIDGGVPANRIDVRAMGGVSDASATDRVDVFTKA
jgi:outer membrane protein OmpA-like peptidoglycan-associated protein